MKVFSLLFMTGFLILIQLRAQVPDNGIDVLDYQFEIYINDTSDIIYGKATLSIRFTRDVESVSLDLASLSAEGKGMKVQSVHKNGARINFSQDPLHLRINGSCMKDEQARYTIIYTGEPADGLVFSNNKFGNRTIFADNWPTRAHQWIPCNDHVSDKAPVDFIVTAPDHYQVISNGIKIEEILLGNHLKRTHWHEASALPPKIMTVGIADFVVDSPGMVDSIPVSSWIYPEDKEKGFYDFAQAIEILPFFIQYIGPYPYRKLANVQSTTIFGGMENANAIFYDEGSITGTRFTEPLLAHEIAHQWFGDGVTEKDWPHIWLSEGFATGMTYLYLENKYGIDSLNSILKTDRNNIIRYSKRDNNPVVDTTKTDNLMKLLNLNSYEKGGWILHMLECEVGDSLFHKSIQNYYKEFAGNNADTHDLQKVFEHTTRLDLSIFFRQWLYTSGQPDLDIGWKYDPGEKMLTVRILQKQDVLFEFPLEIGILKENKMEVETLYVKEKEISVQFPSDAKPVSVIADPGVKLLFESEIIALH